MMANRKDCVRPPPPARSTSTQPLLSAANRRTAFGRARPHAAKNLQMPHSPPPEGGNKLHMHLPPRPPPAGRGLSGLGCRLINNVVTQQHQNHSLIYRRVRKTRKKLATITHMPRSPKPRHKEVPTLCWTHNRRIHFRCCPRCSIHGTGGTPPLLGVPPFLACAFQFPSV